MISILLFIILFSASIVFAAEGEIEGFNFARDVMPTILTTASGLIVAAVGWGLKLLAAYLANKTKNENLKAAFNTLSEIVETTVKDLEQKFKVAMEDGDLSKEEKHYLKQMALDVVNIRLPQFMKEQIEKNVGSFQEYMDSKIEAMVNDLNIP